MANYSLQLQADNLPDEVIEPLLVEGPWKAIMARMMTAENLLLEGCRGAGKTMLMRAAAQSLQKNNAAGSKILGVHTTFKRYLATLPPPSTNNNADPDLGNFRAWTNARILHAVKQTVVEVKGHYAVSQIAELGSVPWESIVSTVCLT